MYITSRTPMIMYSVSYFCTKMLFFKASIATVFRSWLSATRLSVPPCWTTPRS